MCVVSINIPEEILLDLHEDKSGFTSYLQKMLAVDLYKNKKVSLGYCANVAGMTKEEFVQYLGTNAFPDHCLIGEIIFREADIPNCESRRKFVIQWLIQVTAQNWFRLLCVAITHLGKLLLHGNIVITDSDTQTVFILQIAIGIFQNLWQ